MKTTSVFTGAMVWLSWFVPSATAQDAKDWKQYNYDNAGWRFNTAEQALSPANAKRLEQKWRYLPRFFAEFSG